MMQLEQPELELRNNFDRNFVAIIQLASPLFVAHFCGANDGVAHRSIPEL